MPKKAQIKSAKKWVEEGVPFSMDDAGPHVRWVALIQEDAVRCYSISEEIEALQDLVKELKPTLKENLPKDKLEELEFRIRELTRFKMPLD